jgi:hypothetical protein
VGGEHVGIGGVEDGGLHRPLEERLGVVHQIGVQRVVAGDEHGQRALPLPAGAARLLPQGGAGAGVAGEQDGVEPGDVHAEFQRRGGRQPQQLPGVQGALQVPAFLGQVAAPVGGHAAGQVAVGGGQPLLGDHGDQFGGGPGADEGDRADMGSGQIGEQFGGLGGGGAAHGGAAFAAGLGQRRLPQGEDQLAPGRGVLGDLLDGQPGQPRRRGAGLGRGGGGEQEHRTGPVVGGDTPKAAQHLGHVGAEDASVDVALVDDNEAQRAQERRPPPVAGQQPSVEHVGVGQQQVGVLPRPGAFLVAGVAVVGGGPHAGGQGGGQTAQGAQLVGGERLGRREVQGGRAPPAGGVVAVEQRAEHGHLVGQGLAGGGAGGDHDRLAAQGVAGGAGLVLPGAVDAEGPHSLDDLGADRPGPGGMAARPGGQALGMGDAGRTLMPPGQACENRVRRAPRGRRPGGRLGAGLRAPLWGHHRSSLSPARDAHVCPRLSPVRRTMAVRRRPGQAVSG